MSHVIEMQPDKTDQRVYNLHAMQLACTCIHTPSGQQALRMELMQGRAVGADGLLYDDRGQVVTKGTAAYRTWASDHGRLAGDWEVPAGMTADEVGRNAAAVIKLTEAGRKELPGGGHDQPYELGLIPHQDPQTGQVYYGLCHDFFAGGYGLETYIGPTEVDYAAPAKPGGGWPVKKSHGNVLMYYQAMCAKLAAEAAGHSIEFTQAADGHLEAVVDREQVGLLAN